MAEALLRDRAGNRFEVFSAGTQPTVVRPETIAVMEEIGLDITNHRSKSVHEFVGKPIDFLISVCDEAKETQPLFPSEVRWLHWPFDDPAVVQGSTEARDAAFRRVRDQIHARIVMFLGGDESAN